MGGIQFKDQINGLIKLPQRYLCIFKSRTDEQVKSNWLLNRAQKSLSFIALFCSIKGKVKAWERSVFSIITLKNLLQDKLQRAKFVGNKQYSRQKIFKLYNSIYVISCILILNSKQKLNLSENLNPEAFTIIQAYMFLFFHVQNVVQAIKSVSSLIVVVLCPDSPLEGASTKYIEGKGSFFHEKRSLKKSQGFQIATVTVWQ